MIKIDGEEIDGIEICDYLNDLLEETIRTSTYNFNTENKCIEFYLTLNRRLFINEISVVLCGLNLKSYILQNKGWCCFFKKRELGGGVINQNKLYIHM